MSNALASFILKGRNQSVLAVAVFAILSFMMPLMAYFSAAALALIILKHGDREGSVVIAAAVLALSALGWFILGSPYAGISFLIAIWLPIWLLTTVHRRYARLDFTLVIASIVGIVLLCAIYILVGEPSQYWQLLFEEIVPSLAEQTHRQQTEINELKQALELMAPYLTGMFISMTLVGLICSLMIARWWQAGLFNPGGFKTEFYRFSIHRNLTLVVVVAIILSYTTGDVYSSFFRDAAVIACIPFFFQGLSVAHNISVLTTHQLGSVWLIIFYLMMLLTLPQGLILTAMLGVADSWAHMRKRINR